VHAGTHACAAQSSGCSDKHRTLRTGCANVQQLVEVLTSAQIPNLGPLRSAAVHAGVLDAAGGAELVRLLLDLHRQLPRGRQTQHNRPIARLCATALCCLLSWEAQPQ
jgi:hypothetical protein